MSRTLRASISTTEYIRRVKSWNNLILGLVPLCTDVLNKLPSIISYTNFDKSKKLTKSQIEQKYCLDEVVNEILSATSNISLTKNYLQHIGLIDWRYCRTYSSLYDLIKIEKELYPGESSIEQLLSMLKVKGSINLRHIIIEDANASNEVRAKKVSLMSDIRIEKFRKNSIKQIRDAERNYIDFKLKEVYPNLSIIIEEYQNEARKEISEKEREEREEMSRDWKEKQKKRAAKNRWIGIIALISFLFIIILLFYYFKWLGIVALISLFSVFIYSFYK